MKKQKAPGSDGISPIILQNAYPYIKNELLLLFNSLLNLRYFPDCWKSSNIIPIPKPSLDLSNPNVNSYRPISLLPILGKVFERLIIAPLNKEIFLNDNYSKSQYGFTRQTSTIDALLRFKKFIESSFSNKHFVLAVSLDITGAFDNACWSKIIDDLINMNISGNLIELIISFFTNRKASTKFGNFSKTKISSQGCPQGSVIAPIIWNVCLNPLFNLLDSLPEFNSISRQSFADDTILYIAFNKENMLNSFSLMNKVLSIIHNWGLSRFLNFNASKTQAVIFKPNNKLNVINTPVIQMNNITINISNKLKYLGIIFDEYLRFDSHVDYVVNKAKKTLNYLSIHTRNTFGSTPEIIRQLVNSLIYPIITYGSIIWFKTLKTKKFWYKLRSFSYLCEKKITCSYRTSSMASNVLLSGNLSLEYRLIKLVAVDIFKRIGYAPTKDDLEGLFMFETFDNNRRKDLYMKPIVDFLDSKYSLINTIEENNVFLIDVLIFDELNTFSIESTTPCLEPRIHWTIADDLNMYTINEINVDHQNAENLTLSMYNMFIFTDGSKKSEVSPLSNPICEISSSVGYGFCFKLQYEDDYIVSKSFPMGNQCSNYQAECLAICGALSEIVNNNFDILNALICTDSQSVIKDINSLKIDKPIILSIKKYLKIIYSRGISLHIIWVKSHTEITNNILFDGNREADRLANIGSSLPLPSSGYYNCISISSVKTKLENFLWYRLTNYVHSTEKPFGNSPLNKHLKDIIPDPCSSIICNKIKKIVNKLDFYSVQFLNTHGTNGTYLKRIKVIPSDICVLCGCNEVDDINHSLFGCISTFDFTFRLATLNIQFSNPNSIFRFLTENDDDKFSFSDICYSLVILRNQKYKLLASRNNDDLPG